MYRNSIYMICVASLTILGCKKPYNPPIIANPPSYLVVEGSIVAGADSTIFKLSRTVSLANHITANPVTHATLNVESNENITYPLTEVRAGYYAAPGLNLDNTKKYRLRIKTPDNQVYISDFTSVSITPPIDSISHTVLNKGVQINVNTHDPQNKTHYYRWDYQETWQFHSEYPSGVMSDGVKIVYRPADQQIYYCFAGDVSSTILLGSSAKLSQDVIYQSPIAFIEPTSEKIEVRYSILLRQYALTSEAFTFWTNLKKNTEQLGSIFDAQPSQINGNIHNVNNPDDIIVGYIGASTVQKKRIFIDNAEVPPTWRPVYPPSCTVDSFFYSQKLTNFDQVTSELVPLGASYIPLSPFGTPVVEGYTGAYRPCVDCTLRGVVQPPSFW